MCCCTHMSKILIPVNKRKFDCTWGFSDKFAVAHIYLKFLISVAKSKFFKYLQVILKALI